MKQIHQNGNSAMGGNDKKVSARAVARAADVSVGTVSRTFNTPEKVTAAVRARVLAAAKTLGYRPEMAAVRDRVAVLIDRLESLTADYESMVFSAIARNLSERGYGLEIVQIPRSDLAFEHFVKAAISLSYSPNSDEKVRAISQVPVITVNNVIENLPAVCADHAGGVRLAYGYLRERGRRKIVTLSTGREVWGGKERSRGHREADPNGEGAFRFVTGETLFEDVAWALSRKADALIVACEGLALPVCRALTLLGKRVPEDLSVISYETPRLSRYLTPPHTTVDQRLPELAEKAVETALALVAGQNVSPLTLLDSALIERESV